MSTNENSISDKSIVFRFSLSSMITAMVCVVAVVGWLSAHFNYKRVSAQLHKKNELLNAACIQAVPALNFYGIVGQSIDNYPLIQVVAQQMDLPASVALNLKPRWKSQAFDKDEFGNSSEHWQQVDQTRNVTVFRMVLANGTKEGEEYACFYVVVQDSIVRLLIEVRVTAAH